MSERQSQTTDEELAKLELERLREWLFKIGRQCPGKPRDLARKALQSEAP